MESISLNQFVKTALVDKRIRFADLRRLQRDVLPEGPSTRDEAEALLALDQVVQRADRAWPDYLASAIKEFVLSGSTPPGSVDGETAEWLIAALSCSRAKTALAVAREVVREAEHADEALVTFAKGSKRKSKSPPPECDTSRPQLGPAPDRSDAFPVTASWPGLVYQAAAVSIRGSETA